MTHRTHVVTLKGGRRFRARCKCGWSSHATADYEGAVLNGDTHEKVEQMRAEGKL